MDKLLQPLATSHYLLAIANVVALATAAFFAYKAMRWITGIVLSAYHNNIKGLIAAERKRTEDLVENCALSASYFMAYIVEKLVMIFIAAFNVLLGAVALLSSRLGQPISGDYRLITVWVDDKLNYRIISTASIIFALIIVIYLSRLRTIAIKVRRKHEGRSEGDRT